jgi:transposase InsO family protein
VERIHKTIDNEYYQNPDRVWKTLTDWLRYYNEERIHMTLGGITPREKTLQCVTH